MIQDFYVPKKKLDLSVPRGKLGKFFTWEEMIGSSFGIINGIVNTPNFKEQRVIRELVQRLLDPLRVAYKGPIRISSGYRCKELNKKVGGVYNSQHIKGEAADLVINDDASILLGLLLANDFPFDQAILYKKRNFLHVSLRPDRENRKQVIIK